MELREAVKNKLFISLTGGEKSQEAVVNALEFTSQAVKLKQQTVDAGKVGDDQKRYTVLDGQGGYTEIYLGNRVTDAVARYYRKIFGDRKADNTKQMEYGTQVHKAMQTMIDQVQATGKMDAEALINMFGQGEYALTDSQLASLVSSVKAILSEVKDMQNSIDNTKTARLLTENVVVDPRRSIGGTMDLVAVFSDGSTAIYDFKTMSPKGGSVTRNADGAIQLSTTDYVPYSTRMGWEIQMNTYKDVLLEYYGTTNVRYTKMVPLLMGYKYDDKNKISGLNNIIGVSREDKALSTAFKTVGTANYDNAAINAFLKTRYEEIQNLKEAMAKSSRMDRPQLEQRLQSIYDAIDAFTNNMDATYLVKDAVKLASTLTEDEINKMDFAKLKESHTYIKAVIDFKRALTDSASETNIRLDIHEEELAKTAAILWENYINKLLANIESRYGKINMEGGEIRLSEDDLLTLLASTTTESQNPILRHAQDLFQQGYNEQRKELRDFDEALAKVEKPLLEWARSRGETMEQVFNYLVDKDKALFYGRVSQSFRQQINEARSREDVSFFLNNYQRRSGKNAKGQTYSEWYAATLKEITEVYTERYKKVEDTATRERLIKNSIATWKENNDLSLNNLGQPLHRKAWFKKNYWLEIKPAVIIANESQEYRFIKDNAPLLNYYQFLHDTVAKWRSEVGYDMIHSSLFYPMVRASMIEKLGRDRAFPTLLKDVKESLEVKQDSQMFGSMEYEEMEDKKIPLYFTQPFRDSDGNIDTAQLSKDISASFRLMAKTVSNHKHMSKIEAEVLALQDMIKMVKYEEGGWGRKVFDFMHNAATKEKSGSASMTATVFDAIKDYHLYGIKTQGNLSPSTKYVVEKLLSYFSLRSLGLGIIPAASSYVAGQVNARLEAVKGQIWDTEKWNKATNLMVKDHKKYHAIAFFFGVHNEDMLTDIMRQREGGIKSVLGNPLYSSNLNRYLDQRLLMSPWSYGQERLDNHITVAMAQSYGFDKDGNVRLLVNLPAGTKNVYDSMVLSDNNVWSIEGLDEEQSKRAIMQFQQAVRAGQKRVTGTLSQEDIAYWQTTLAGKIIMQFKSWMPSILKERFGALRFNDVLDVSEEGRYRAVWANNEFEDNANTVVYFFRTLARTIGFVGKNLLTYNSIARMIGGKLVLNDELMQKHYAMFKKKYENYPGMLAKFPTYESFIAMRQGQVRAALGEIEVMLLLVGAIAMLGADWDDDGEPLWSEMWLTHQMYKVINRTKTEVSFTYDPAEYIKLVSNPIPITGLLNHVKNLLVNTVDETVDVLSGREDARDKTGKLHYTTGLIQGAYQLRKFLDILETDQAATR